MAISKLNVGMHAMRRPDAHLVQTFSYYGKPDYWITPSGSRVEAKIAEQIIAHPQVIGGKDGNFPDIIRRGASAPRGMRDDNPNSTHSIQNGLRQPRLHFLQFNACLQPALPSGGGTDGHV